MDRREIMREFARKEGRGIEIGPYFTPLVPKADGWNVLALDVFDAAKLRDMALADPNIPAASICDIEEVDLLGPAHRIAELVGARGESGKIDFILSSHNFEHLPNPVAFLRGCSEVLRPGAVLSMAIPDKRTCFDYFRPLSTLAAMLEAYAENRERPTATQLLEMQTLHARYRTEAGELGSFPLTDDPSHVVAHRTMEEAYANWKVRLARGSNSEIYEDCHCWTFTPSSFRLVLADLRFLGLIEFEPVKISETQGHEFFVHLRNLHGAAATTPNAATYYEERQALLHAVNWDPALNAVGPAGSAAMADASAGITSLRDEIALLREETHVLQQSFAGLMAAAGEAEAMRREIGRIRGENGVLQRDNTALRNSRSWRVTAPLRFLGDAVRGRRSSGTRTIAR